MDTERKRKTEHTILQAISRVGQNTLAARMGTSESTISRLKDDGARLTVGQMAELLSELGLKAVPSEMRCYPDRYIENMHFFAQIGMKASPEDVSRMMVELEF